MSIATKLTELLALEQRLATAKTNIATAITNKGGTVGSGDGFEDFATDIGTIPTGTTPTGTININANGIYDVTSKASAVVNVVSRAENCIKVEFTLTQDTSGIYNVLTGDADIIAHYADINASCLLECLDAIPASPTDRIRWIYASNTPLYGSYYQTRVQNVGGWTQAFSGSPLSNANANHNIWARSNGNLAIVLQASRPLVAGNYRITFMW